jgi:hypothetical protein
MGMEIDAVAEGLDAGHNPRHKLCASDCLEVFVFSIQKEENLHHSNLFLVMFS